MPVPDGSSPLVGGRALIDFASRVTLSVTTVRDSAPGQGARREGLAQLYDGLGDVEKLGLSQFAEDLSDETRGPSAAQATTRFPPVPGRRGDDCALFEFQDGSRRVSCSVSRHMEAFERL